MVVVQQRPVSLKQRIMVLPDDDNSDDISDKNATIDSIKSAELFLYVVAFTLFANVAPMHVRMTGKLVNILIHAISLQHPSN